MKLNVKQQIVLSLVIAVLFFGCGMKRVRTDNIPYWGAAPQAEMMEAEMDEVMATASTDEVAESPPGSATGKAVTPSKRMMHYNGYVKLKVVKPSETIDEVADIVTRAGGYVETRRERSAGFRVPVKEFKRIYNEVLALGIVLKKSVSAEDVTDQFTDMKLRLQVAKQSLKRYMELLAKSRDEEEKIRLLKEISRLNEEIEYLENASTLLSLLADFSRLNLETVPYNKVTERVKLNEIDGFSWINSLSPFDRSVAADGEKYAFEVPEKLVEIKGDIWKTESADGTIFRAHKRKNEPAGDTDFWIRAIRVRLEKEFASVDLKTVGGYTYLRLVSLSEKPYIYYVGLRAEDRYLMLFEAYFPDKAQEEAYQDAILRVVKQEASK